MKCQVLTDIREVCITLVLFIEPSTIIISWCTLILQSSPLITLIIINSWLNDQSVMNNVSTMTIRYYQIFIILLLWPLKV